MTQNYPSLETAAITPTRSVCRFGFVQVSLTESDSRSYLDEKRLSLASADCGSS